MNEINVREIRGQSRICNPEVLATLGTQDTEQKQILKMMSNTDSIKNRGWTRVLEGYVVPASYEAPVMLLIY
jgi:hypothetical protein